MRRSEVAAVSRADIKHWFKSAKLKPLRLCILTTLTGILLLISVLLSSRRRRSKNRVLKAILWTTYAMTSYLIGFTMGQMHTSSSEDYNSDNMVWAIYLLIVFSSADSFTSYGLVDSEQWRRYNWQFVLKLGGLVIIIVIYYQVYPIFTWPIILLMVLTIISKVLMKNLSIEASATDALHRNCKHIKDYMIREHEVAGDVEQYDPLSMRGYRYLVHGEPSMTQGPDDKDNVVTLENVWNCRWELLSSRNTGDRLKDTCVSFSFYRLLRLKYAGYKLPREVNRKSFHLVRHGLMASNEKGYERAFKVIEDELALLFDSFYTKRPIIFEPRSHRLWLRFAEFLLLLLVYSALIVSIFEALDFYLGESDSLEHILYDITIIVGLTTYLFAESFQTFALLFTTWMKVNCICKYVKGDLWQKRPFRRKCIERICNLRSSTPWERKLHQYSLFESYAHDPLRLLPKRFLDMFIESPRNGQKEGHPIDLSEEVRNAVFDCLKNISDSSSDDGIVYLRKPDVSWEFDVDLELEFQAEVIMVWHIATTMCNGRPSSSEGQKNHRVATTLSKYLAYLVAFVPRLLPDHPYLTEQSFDQTIAEARLLWKGCKTVTVMIDKLRESERESEENNKTILIRGARLEKQLSEAKVEADAIWETLAKFWVEMTLYIAPSKDNRAHAEILAIGGEFLTHLWAILYHAGIERSKGSTSTHQHAIHTSVKADLSFRP